MSITLDKYGYPIFWEYPKTMEQILVQQARRIGLRQ